MSSKIYKPSNKNKKYAVKINYSKNKSVSKIKEASSKNKNVVNFFNYLVKKPTQAGSYTIFK